MKLNQYASPAAFFAANRLAANANRPFIDKNGEPCVFVNQNGKPVKMRANAALLRYDEWKDIDRQVIGIATQRLTGIADLVGRGLTHNLGGLGVSMSLWQSSSDLTEANVSMSGGTSGEEDSVAFNTNQVPVPIIHKDFRLDIRRLEASRRHGEALDTLTASIAARVVAEKSEDMLFAGLPIQVEGNTIYGYTTFPGRVTVDMGTPWDQLTPEQNGQIVEEVNAMLAAARANRYYGPFVLYIPGNYEGKLDEDYRSAGDQRTLRERIMALNGISEIKVADRLEGDNVILVQMTKDVIDLAIGQDITTIQWVTMGGMVEHFRVMACWAPRLKSDFDNHAGIVHLSTSTT